MTSPSTRLGVPLLLASAILLAAAVLGAATRRPARRTTQGIRSLFENSGLRVSTTPLAGTWVLLAAVAVAAGAALSQWGAREWADPEAAYADTPTPPSGVVITVLPPEAD